MRYKELLKVTEEELKDLEYDLKLMAAESKIFDTDAIRERIDKLFRYIENDVS